jgi:hypothetical protein
MGRNSEPPYVKHLVGDHILVASTTASHWQNVMTLKLWISEVVWKKHTAVCSRGFPGQNPHDVHSILHIDAYPVHISNEFIGWLRSVYPSMHPVFVPANCTSKVQIADVLLNRPFKALYKKLYNRRLTEQAMAGRSDEADALSLRFSTAVRETAKPSISWLLESFESLKKLDFEPTLQSIGYSKCFSSEFQFDAMARAREVDEAAIDESAWAAEACESGDEGDTVQDEGYLEDL